MLCHFAPGPVERAAKYRGWAPPVLKPLVWIPNCTGPGEVGGCWPNLWPSRWKGATCLSRALQAFYTRVDLMTLHMWACQALCMIAEYHLACITRGSPVTSPILPRELEEHLLPLMDYAPPEDRAGITDV